MLIMRKRVLVVDHSPLARSLAQTILAGAGYDVREAANGEEALAVLGAERIDLVVSEIEMPGLDGIELLKEMKSDTARGAIPFVALTTESGRHRIEQGRKEGAVLWIQKPYRPELLLDVVERHTRDR